eukprot:scaffold124211_cov32-Tisochrysis_lutea.AAC.3
MASSMVLMWTELSSPNRLLTPIGGCYRLASPRVHPTCHRSHPKRRASDADRGVCPMLLRCHVQVSSDDLRLGLELGLCLGIACLYALVRDVVTTGTTVAPRSLC